MARLARAVVPGVPHHVVQRGVRRMRTFFGEEDYRCYIALMAESCAKHGVDVWGYCLMPNHVHLIAVPGEKDSLARGIGEAHRRYTLQVNRRHDWKGYLWQGRFASFPMDDAHLLAAIRYVENNPVRAQLVVRADAYVWSSARAHIAGEDDRLVKVKPLLDRVDDWRDLLSDDHEGSESFDRLRRHTRTGRPLGGETFVADVSMKIGRDLAKQKPGPKRRADK